MYYTGIDPLTMENVYVPRSADEKKMQRALMQSYKAENAPIVRKALEKAGRHDLINGKNPLLPPQRNSRRSQGKR
jgi:hypothetical protein